MSLVTDLPAIFDQFSEARQTGFLTVMDLKERGIPLVGTYCTFMPQEIPMAAGAVVVSLCSTSDETIEEAEKDLPRNLCPLIKSSYGFGKTDKCPYFYFSDLVVGETTCDGKKKMYELLNEIRPTYILHLPQGERENALDEWTAELRRFKNFLEDKFGVAITDDALRRAAIQRNKERRARIRLMEVQKNVPPMAKGLNLYTALDGAGFVFDPADRVAMLTNLYNDVAAAYASGARPVSEGDKRILITGCPIGGVMNKTVKTIEENGGAVVCFENCTGIKAAYQLVDTEADDIMAAIAKRYLDIGCAVMTPNSVRVELLKQLISEYKIDGVVEIDLQSCTPYTIETHFIRREMEKLGIHYIALETDYSQSDSGQLSTRLEAFLEML